MPSQVNTKVEKSPRPLSSAAVRLNISGITRRIFEGDRERPPKAEHEKMRLHKMTQDGTGRAIGGNPCVDIEQLIREVAQLRRSLDKVMDSLEKTCILRKQKERRPIIPPKGALRHPYIQKLVITWSREGRTLKQISAETRRIAPPWDQGSLSKSSLQRFLQRARRGNYREFGIDGWGKGQCQES